MDFFDRQERAHRKTALLIVYFALAVVGIIATLQMVFSWLLGVSWTHLELLAWVGGSTLLLVAGGSLFRMAELSQGGRVVAAMLGGQPVSPHTTDLGERRLLNVVEEMAIASGVPVPELFVLPDPGINAFAAGHGPGDTAIGVTRGAIERLTRDELQGVVGHEFSHILHGDMRLNIRLIGLLHGILCVALLGGILIRITFYMSDDSNDRNKGGGVFFFVAAGLALYAIGWIGVFFGNLIKSAVSRQREFLADASAVQYTRNPDGLAGALWKIGKSFSRLANPRAAEASHMFFANGVREPVAAMFATHPPIPERIAAIAPRFDPSKLGESPGLPRMPAQPPPLPSVPASGMFAASGGAAPGFAGALLASLPAEELAAAAEIGPACALVYALVLDDDAARRQAQLDALDGTPELKAAVLGFFARRCDLVGSGRLALVDLAMPALRTMSHKQYAAFRANMTALMESDRQIDLFEFVLQKVLVRHLDLYFTRSTGAAVRFRSVAPLLPDVGVLLSAIVLVGHPDSPSRRKAFAAGVRELLVKPSTYPLEPADSTDIATIDSALDRLAMASPDVKRTVLSACAQAAAEDGAIAPPEYELVRAIADTLDCPVPPVLHPGDERRA